MEKEPLTSAFSRLHLKLVSTVRSVLGTGTDVDDVLQDAFCRLWPRRGDISSDIDASGLVITTVRNMSIDTLRRRLSHPTVNVVEESAIPATWVHTPDCDNTGERELVTEVMAIMDRTLTPRQRDILYKRECGGWEIADLAELYGLTEPNVRIILSRARAAVREAYRKNSEL